MTAQAHALQLLDLVEDSAGVVATLRVTPSGDRYRGVIDMTATPPLLRQLFEQFERNVEGQLFTAADEVEEEIARLRLQVRFPNGVGDVVENLQVYPSTGRVSFTLHDTSGVN